MAKKRKLCVEGLSCRYSCINKDKSCQVALTGDTKSLGNWLSRATSKVTSPRVSDVGALRGLIASKNQQPSIKDKPPSPISYIPTKGSASPTPSPTSASTTTKLEYKRGTKERADVEANYAKTVASAANIPKDTPEYYQNLAKQATYKTLLEQTSGTTNAKRTILPTDAYTKSAATYFSMFGQDLINSAQDMEGAKTPQDIHEKRQAYLFQVQKANYLMNLMESGTVPPAEIQKLNSEIDINNASSYLPQFDPSEISAVKSFVNPNYSIGDAAGLTVINNRSDVYIKRYLAQGGRDGYGGFPLNPIEGTLDHLVSLSNYREEQKKSDYAVTYDNPNSLSDEEFFNMTSDKIKDSKLRNKNGSVVATYNRDDANGQIKVFYSKDYSYAGAEIESNFIVCNNRTNCGKSDGKASDTLVNVKSKVEAFNDFLESYDAKSKEYVDPKFYPTVAKLYRDSIGKDADSKALTEKLENKTLGDIMDEFKNGVDEELNSAIITSVFQTQMFNSALTSKKSEASKRMASQLGGAEGRGKNTPIPSSTKGGKVELMTKGSTSKIVPNQSSYRGTLSKSDYPPIVFWGLASELLDDAEIDKLKKSKLTKSKDPSTDPSKITSKEDFNEIANSAIALFRYNSNENVGNVTSTAGSRAELGRKLLDLDYMFGTKSTDNKASSVESPLVQEFNTDPNSKANLDELEKLGLKSADRAALFLSLKDIMSVMAIKDKLNPKFAPGTSDDNTSVMLTEFNKLLATALSKGSESVNKKTLLEVLTGSQGNLSPDDVNKILSLLGTDITL